LKTSDERDALRIRIGQTWEGAPIGAEEAVDLRLVFSPRELRIELEAPFHGDPAPAAPPGPVERLFDFEVVEVFLLGRDERYLEVELGPHGHHLVLELRGARQVERSLLPLEYRAEIRGRRWRGVARVPAGLLPPGLARANAYAIHGQGEARRYLAWQAVPGPAPDFHRLERFAPIRGSGQRPS
jgi:hypothetical protein